MELARRQREAAEAAERADREAELAKAQQRAAVQEAQRRQIAEHADKMRKTDESEQELKFNQSVLKKIEEFKVASHRSPSGKQAAMSKSASAAAMRAKDRATAVSAERLNDAL